MNGKKWTTLLIMSLSSLMATINSSSLNSALPYLAKILHLSLNESQMILVVYLIVLTSILTICGKIADIFGHKKIFLIGTLIFGVSSLIVLPSERISLLISMRIIQAIGASFMVASGPAILLSVFEPEKRGFAIGMHTTGISLGLIIGPPIGGLILQYLSWQWLFLINLPFSIIIFVAIMWIVDYQQNYQLKEEQNHYDIYGMLLWSLSIPLILISMSMLSHSNSTTISLFMLLIGIILILILIKHEIKVDKSFFPINLIKIPAYYGGLFSLLIGYTALFISNFLIPFYLKLVLNLEPQQTGFIMSITSIAMFLTTGVSGYISDKIGYYKLCITGMILLTIGMLLLALTKIESALIQISIAQIIIGSGLGIFNSPNTTALLNISGMNNTGITTGLLATMRNLGMSLGTVIGGISVSFFSTTLFGNKVEKINEIPPEIFNSLFKYSLIIAFLLSTVSIYLSTIRKGSGDLSISQK